ncbi:hypothetical protein HYU91_03000 [Candidatus Collierbacteria bacterium]|nr:hypothetical protein [Candidatus Collierbacteria bacterium]
MFRLSNAKSKRGGPEFREIVASVEWPNQAVENADKIVAQAAWEIRQYYFRQIHLLRQIPYLALEANGHGGWLDECGRAYRHCIMAVHQEEETFGSYDMFIELRSGVLIGATSPDKSYYITPAQTIQFGENASLSCAGDKEIYTKLAHQDERFRFNVIDKIHYLKEMAERPYHNQPEEVADAFRDKEQYRLELDEMMATLPEEQVLDVLRSRGFDI